MPLNTDVVQNRYLTSLNFLFVVRKHFVIYDLFVLRHVNPSDGILCLEDMGLCTFIFICFAMFKGFCTQL